LAKILDLEIDVEGEMPELNEKKTKEILASKLKVPGKKKKKQKPDLNDEELAAE
jgi:hypothetical protein